jgi:hypothetical protein
MDLNLLICRRSHFYGYDICRSFSAHFSSVAFKLFHISANYRTLFVESADPDDASLRKQMTQLHLISLRVLQEIIRYTPSILVTDVPIGLTILKKLFMDFDDPNRNIQAKLLEILLLIFRRENGLHSLAKWSTTGSQEGLVRQKSVSRNRVYIKETIEDTLGPISLLLQIVLDALSSPNCRPALNLWTSFFIECLSYFTDSLFPILLPTVDCICREVRASLEDVERAFSCHLPEGADSLSHIAALMNLLESLLFQAYDIWRADEVKFRGSKSGYDGAGFLSDIMSGVRSTEGLQGRSAAANVRFEASYTNARIG